MANTEPPRGWYAGIGSRETPENICKTMTTVAETLETAGFGLHSGHADGADIAFEEGAKTKRIFLPWVGFNRASPGEDGHMVLDYTIQLEDLAMKFHPNWNAVSGPAKRLLARNGYQILGPKLDTPVQFVICWTKEGKREGGTGQALRIADHYKIPIVDLGHPNGMDLLVELGTYL